MDGNIASADALLAAVSDIVKAVDANTLAVRELREEVAEDAGAIVSAVTSAGNAAYQPYGAVGLPNLIDGIYCTSEVASHELRDIRVMLEQQLDSDGIKGTF